MNFMRYVLLMLCFNAMNNIYAQVDWVKWGEAKPDYQLHAPEHKSYGIAKTNFGTRIISGLQTGYYVLFSDYDGDNCPFHPSCSAFFVRAVKETNVFKGSLMFADRFMRDTNLFKRAGYYPLHISGKLYDPVENYTLRQSDVKYYPRDLTVE